MISAFRRTSRISMARRKARWILTPVLLVIMRAPAGHAQSAGAETRTVARDLARQGADAFDQQDYATALDRLTRAYSLFRAPTISLMQARALTRLGRLVEALDKYEETHHTALGDEPSEAFVKAMNDAKAEGDELRPRIPRLLIKIRAADGRADGLSVQLDGKPVPAALLDVERPVDPGTHQVAVTAHNYESLVRYTRLTEGDRVVLELPLAPVSKAARTVGRAPAAPKPEPSPSSPAEPATTAVWGWLGVAVGTAGLASSAITGVVALQRKSTLDSVCRPGCPSSAAEDIDSFRSMRTISYVSLAVGAASLGLGGYLLLSGSPEAAHVGVSVGPGNAGIGGAF
jgi:hypothetical protein